MVQFLLSLNDLAHNRNVQSSFSLRGARRDFRTVYEAIQWPDSEVLSLVEFSLMVNPR